MALIKCPECEKEVSSFATECVHCGCPLNKEIQNNVNQQSDSNKMSLSDIMKNKKMIVAISIIAILLFSYFGLFRLGAEEKYAYDLIIENAGDFKNPKGIKIISGTAGWDDEDDEPYAFVCITSTNGYGAKTTGYYLLGPSYIYDVSDDSGSVKFCKKDKLNISNINRRLSIYWLFH